MRQKLLSIIIPIYNVSATLRRCIDSILMQNDGSYEILLVDDGSTDGSGDIADEYAGRNTCIRCLHKSNGGLSDARNYGLAHASGYYVTFADSDDEVHPGTYPTLMRIMEEHPDYDILEYPVLQNPGQGNETMFCPGEHVFNDALDWLAYKGAEHCWAWNKIYRTSLFDGVTYPVGRKFEDVLVLADILKKRPVVATTNHGRYLYHYNADGITATDRAAGLASLLGAQMQLVEELGIDTHERRWHRLYVDMLAVQIVSFRTTGTIKLWSQHVALCGYATWKDTFKALLLNTIGLRQTCRLLSRI